MATLDEIGHEKRKLSERLTQLGAERAKLSDQLSELEVAERVLTRFGGVETTERRGRGRTARTAPAPPPRRGRARATQPAHGVSLRDATLRAVQAHPEGATASEVLGYLYREFRMTVRPSHLAIALQRHRRAGRLENQDSRWFLPQMTAAVPAAERGRAQANQPAQGISLSDATLRVVQTHPEGATASEVLGYLYREFRMTVRPSHLGIALQRHRRAGRLESSASRWFPPEFAAAPAPAIEDVGGDRGDYVSEEIPLIRSDRPPRIGGELFVPVHYATNRKATGKKDANLYYGSERGPLRYGLALVSIPADHDIGIVERPSVWRFEFSENPQKHIILRQLKEMSQLQFVAHLEEDLALLTKKTAFVFVHGFNVTFAAAARRAAQMAYDLFLVGQQSGEATLSTVPLLYSWPSNGDMIRYAHDANNAEASGALLKAFLKEVVVQSGAESITIIAHSMGNRALTTALNDIGLSMPPGDGPLVREIILAAPDIDRDVFLNIANAVKRTGERVTLYASEQDKALQISKALNGFPRLGDARGGITVVPGVDSIDASVVGDDVLAHSYYGETSLLSDLYALIMQGNSPDKRFGLLSHGISPNRYWIMRPRT